MMTTHVYVELNDFVKYADNMEKVARQAVNATILRIELRAKLSLGGLRTGRTYQVGNVTRRLLKSERSQVGVSREFGRLFMRLDGMRVEQAGRGFKVVIGAKIHRASAPGEPPATDTGNLGNSIGSRMTGKTEGEVTVTAEYAAALELGSAHIAPRPFFAPAVKAEWPGFLAAMKAIAE